MPRGAAALRRPAATNILLGLALAVAGALAPAVAARWARPALIEFGPNDVGYTSGFRQDWERDGLTRFRWTGTHSTVRLPVGVSGDGVRLRARLRRHLVEPAEVTVYIANAAIGRFDIQADLHSPYRTIDLPVPPSTAVSPVVITIQATSANPRPLGVALDWLEVDRGNGRFALTNAHLLRLAIVIAAAFAFPLLAGAPRVWAAAHGAILIALVTLGTAWDVIACERIVSEGTLIYVAAGALATVVARSQLRAVLQVDSPRVAGALAMITLCAVALRLVLVLHPQFYYPDVKVHALFAWQLARHGLWRFLEEFTANQYRFSLGLQMENGHWYAFPYPPAFYILCWPFIRLAPYRPEVAVSVVAALVNSLEVWIVFGFARRLRCAAGTALAAAAALIVLPIFTARITLAYFPALVGHAVDAAVLLVILARLRDLGRPRVMAGMAFLVAAALLTYTQSVLNFAILVPLIVIAHLAIDHDPQVRRRMAGLVAATGLGGLLALAIFYGRYVPIFLDMQKGIPMAEERILIEKQEQAAAIQDAPPAVPDNDDPYAGPRFDALRGLRKAGWRMYVFYGAFAPIIALGVVLLYRRQDASAGAFVAAWAVSYLALNFASGSLPGPNLVRYNKDLELVAPLFCVALAVVAESLWRRSRPLAWAFALAYATFAGTRAATYLTTKFVLER